MEVLDSRDPAMQLNITNTHVENKSKANIYLNTINLQVTFCKKVEDSETKYLSPFYLSSKTQTIVIDLDIDNSFNNSF